MWERFSYYGMRALLILFMTAAPGRRRPRLRHGHRGRHLRAVHVDGVHDDAAREAGSPTALIGPQRAVLYGGILIASGHFSMAVPSLTTFYLGLLLIVIGTGLLKGNVSVIVGRLYSAHDARRDAGYSIFYMGINTGAFIAPLVCGYLGQRVNWHLGFAAAGVGMVLGLVQYMLGRKYLGDAGRYPATSGSPEALARQRRSALTWSTALVVLLIGDGLGAYSGVLPVTPTQIADAAGYFLLGLTVAFFGWLYSEFRLDAAERKQLYVIGVLFLAAALFWSQFEQAGSTLNLFADRNTRTSMLGWTFPSTWFQSLNSLFIITLAPLFAWIWVWLARRGAEPSSPAKFGCGPRTRGRRIRGAGGRSRSGRAGRACQPDVAGGRLFPAHVRRALP